MQSVGALRPGLDSERSTDVLWLLNSPTVYRHLVHQASWSHEDYESWLAEAMVRELLHEGDQGAPDARPR